MPASKEDEEYLEFLSGTDTDVEITSGGCKQHLAGGDAGEAALSECFEQLASREALPVGASQRAGQWTVGCWGKSAGNSGPLLRGRE